MLTIDARSLLIELVSRFKRRDAETAEQNERYLCALRVSTPFCYTWRDRRIIDANVRGVTFMAREGKRGEHSNCMYRNWSDTRCVSVQSQPPQSGHGGPSPRLWDRDHRR